MYESVKAGKILDLPSDDTLSDATTGGIEPGSVSIVMINDSSKILDLPSDDTLSDGAAGGIEQVCKYRID